MLRSMRQGGSLLSLPLYCLLLLMLLVLLTRWWWIGHIDVVRM